MIIIIIWKGKWERVEKGSENNGSMCKKWEGREGMRSGEKTFTYIYIFPFFPLGINILHDTTGLTHNDFSLPPIARHQCVCCDPAHAPAGTVGEGATHQKGAGTGAHRQGQQL